MSQPILLRRPANGTVNLARDANETVANLTRELKALTLKYDAVKVITSI